MEKSEASEIADRAIKRFDDMYFEQMTKILDEVRRQNKIRDELADRALDD